MYTKYRGKDISTRQWVYGVLYWNHPECTNPIIINGNKEYTVDKNTIGMCINYSDSFGTEIYTGDVVNFNDFSIELVWFCNELQCLETVNLKRPFYVNAPKYEDFLKWDFHNYDTNGNYEEFCLMLQDPYGDFADKIKVIGNVFDNPELIEIKGK